MSKTYKETMPADVQRELRENLLDAVTGRGAGIERAREILDWVLAQPDEPRAAAIDVGLHMARNGLPKAWGDAALAFVING